MTKNKISEHAKEQEAKVQILLENIADTLSILDIVNENGTCTSAFIEYDEQDVFNSLKIFFHVAGNYAIHHRILTEENVYDKINTFREMIKDVFGVDSAQEWRVSTLMSDVRNCIGGKQ